MRADCPTERVEKLPVTPSPAVIGEGREAYFRGDGQDDCPYPIKPSTGDRTAWFEGWLQARHEEETDQPAHQGSSRAISRRASRR